MAISGERESNSQNGLPDFIDEYNRLIIDTLMPGQVFVARHEQTSNGRDTSFYELTGFSVGGLRMKVDNQAIEVNPDALMRQAIVTDPDLGTAEVIDVFLKPPISYKNGSSH